jgi:hypothetical protein
MLIGPRLRLVFSWFLSQKFQFYLPSKPGQIGWDNLNKPNSSFNTIAHVGLNETIPTYGLNDIVHFGWVM